MKLAFLLLGTMWGMAAAIAASIAPMLASTPPATGQPPIIGHETPITIAIALGGISVSFILAWRVRGVFDDLRHEVSKLTDRVGYLERKVDRIQSGK